MTIGIPDKLAGGRNTLVKRKNARHAVDGAVVGCIENLLHARQVERPHAAEASQSYGHQQIQLASDLEIFKPLHRTP